MLKPALIFVLIVGGIALLYPMNVTVAPEWQVSVVDGEGRPLAGFKVREVWQHYSVESSSHVVDYEADSLGRLQFPERRIRASVLKRFAGCARQVVNYFVHASCGPVAYLIPLTGSEFGETKSSFARVAYRGSGRQIQTQIVLERCKQPRSDIGLFC